MPQEGNSLVGSGNGIVQKALSQLEDPFAFGIVCGVPVTLCAMSTLWALSPLCQILFLLIGYPLAWSILRYWRYNQSKKSELFIDKLRQDVLTPQWERSKSEAALKEAIAIAHRNDRLAVVVGESGVGKTTLINSIYAETAEPIQEYLPEAWNESRTEKSLIILDQFEECLTLSPPGIDRTKIDRSIKRLIENATQPLKSPDQRKSVIIVIRKDCFGPFIDFLVNTREKSSQMATGADVNNWNLTDCYNVIEMSGIPAKRDEHDAKFIAEFIIVRAASNEYVPDDKKKDLVDAVEGDIRKDAPNQCITPAMLDVARRGLVALFHDSRDRYLTYKQYNTGKRLEGSLDRYFSAISRGLGKQNEVSILCPLCALSAHYQPRKKMTVAQLVSTISRPEVEVERALEYLEGMRVVKRHVVEVTSGPQQTSNGQSHGEEKMTVTSWAILNDTLAERLYWWCAARMDSQLRESIVFSADAFWRKPNPVVGIRVIPGNIESWLGPLLLAYLLAVGVFIILAPIEHAVSFLFPPSPSLHSLVPTILAVHCLWVTYVYRVYVEILNKVPALNHTWTLVPVAMALALIGAFYPQWWMLLIACGGVGVCWSFRKLSRDDNISIFASEHLKTHGDRTGWNMVIEALLGGLFCWQAETMTDETEKSVVILGLLFATMNAYFCYAVSYKHVFSEGAATMLGLYGRWTIGTVSPNQTSSDSSR